MTLGDIGQAWVMLCTEYYGRARIQGIYASYERVGVKWYPYLVAYLITFIFARS